MQRELIEGQNKAESELLDRGVFDMEHLSVSHTSLLYQNDFALQKINQVQEFLLKYYLSIFQAIVRFTFSVFLVDI